MRLGTRLRDARLRRGLSLRALGTLTGFSASFLSQVELDRASPSLASLHRIAEALGVTVASVLTRHEQTASVMTRKHERASHRSAWSNATLEPLVNGAADEKLEAVLIRLEPGGRTGATTYARGRRLFGYCLSGEIRVLLGAPPEELAAGCGDSIVIEGPRTAAFENHGPSAAELLVVTAIVA